MYSHSLRIRHSTVSHHSNGPNTSINQPVHRHDSTLKLTLNLLKHLPWHKSMTFQLFPKPPLLHRSMTFRRSVIASLFYLIIRLNDIQIVTAKGNREALISSSVSRATTATNTSGNSHSPNNSTTNLTPTSKPSRSDPSDGLKSFKVSLDDPAWKVLPAALKKYKINNDDWQNYAMFICYGSTGTLALSPAVFSSHLRSSERCLSYDEKPLLLFQRLKDAKKNPVFMLKHIRDIRSPIAVAQQKQAARQTAKATEAATAASTPSSSSHPSKATISVHGNSRVAALTRQQSLRTGRDTPSQSGTPPSKDWPPSEVLSPAVDAKHEDEKARSALGGVDEPLPDGSVVGRDVVIPPANISYAVAIYPYMAEQEDEFDVVV